VRSAVSLVVASLLVISRHFNPRGTANTYSAIQYIIEDIETSYWTSGNLYGNSIGKNHGSINLIDVFKGVVDDVNKEFFDPHLNTMIESIEFGHNCVIITKRGEVDEKYSDRIYRMSSFVDGYNYNNNDNDE